MNGDDMEENGLRAHRRRPLEALYSEVKRIDQLSEAESRRVDGLLKNQETAVTAALAAAEKAVAAALAASEKAVAKAEVAQQRVNEGQNEFRGQLKDQAANLMPRIETEQLLKALRAEMMLELRPLKDNQSTAKSLSDTNVGRSLGRSELIATVVAGLVVAGAVFGIIVKLIG